jgi:TetR/AcrR family transcriptional regulator, transcriptional repressor for nem operon
MSAVAKKSRNPEETRRKLVSAARDLVLQRGFTGAGIDRICADAGVTKGAFFHHFKSKDEIGRAALADWAAFGMEIYAAAKAEPVRQPLDHVHRFFDIMAGLVTSAPSPVTCVVGIISQELATANPVLRETCATYLGDWTEFARQLLEEAKTALPPRVDFDAEEVAWFLNSVWQGSMLIAKTRRDPQIILKNLARARAHVDGLFFGKTRPDAHSETKSTSL